MHAALRHNQAARASLLKIAEGYLRIARSGKAGGKPLTPGEAPGIASMFARRSPPAGTLDASPPESFIEKLSCA
jgi:hypothetical protein